MKSQWECVLQNLGEWHGSFTHLSAQGELLEDVPSQIRLEGVNQNQSIHLVLRRFYPAQPGSTDLQPSDLVLDFSTTGVGSLFFESGAFSQGSIYCFVGSQFGAELCLVQEPRRLRLVLIFNPDGLLDRLTLIREKRPTATAPERPPLTLNHLLGEWHGAAVTLYPDDLLPETHSTKLVWARESEERLVQYDTGDRGETPSTPTALTLIADTILTFEQNRHSYQVLLLPDGASLTCPTQITRGQAFFLEVGWLFQPGHRQRIIRHYNAEGKWTHLTLVTESQVG